MNYPKGSIMLNDNTLENTIEKHHLVVVACLPTMELTFGNPQPVIDAMAKKYEKKVVFGLLNVNENKRIASRYKIKTTPVILVFRNQRLVAQLKNNVTRKDIEDRIEPYL